MEELQLRTIPAAADEFSKDFLQGMLDRMAMSFYKYGKVADAYPRLVNALNSMQLRLGDYKKTGNRDALIDAANFLMIEFMHPAHRSAHFRATDSHESPGRVWNGERVGVADTNNLAP